MIKNELRIGRFTSSEIYKLLGTPKGRATYIAKKRYERRLGKSVGREVYKKEMAWGKFMEIVIFQSLGMGYRMTSKSTTAHYRHKEIWSGSVDLIVPKVKIGEIKAYQYEKYCAYTECLMKKDVQLLKKQFPQEYWQLVSNAIIHRVKVAEAISFMPYESEIPAIQEMVDTWCKLPENSHEAWQYRFIYESDIDQLPCLKDDGYYQNITTFEFEVPQADMLLLDNEVRKAGIEMLEAA